MSKINILNLLLAASLFLLAGCPRRAPVPDLEVSRLEAEHAIARARSEIFEADRAGADVSGPEEILEEALSFFNRNDYAGALNRARRAGEEARRLKQERLALLRGRSDAEAAIQRARRLIDRAADMGGDTGQAEDVIGESKTKLNEGDYDSSLLLADEAAALAQDIIDFLSADTYVVGTWERDRDCLWNIAAREEIYNDPWKWKKIYRANQEKIEMPDLIYPGQRLIIPRD